MARREKARICQERSSTATLEGGALAALPLLDFIPRITRGFMAPRHLSMVAEKLERFREEPFRFVFSVPPRHGKSQLIFHWIAWALVRHPGLRIAYVTVNSKLAAVQAQLCRRMCVAAGVDFTNRSETTWYVKGGGSVAWEGVNGTLIGRGFDVVIVDDPIKSRAEAESPTYRDRAWSFYQNDCVTRLQPGASFLCIQTRWHEDDLAGRLTRANPEENFRPLEYVNMPAIANEGIEGAEVALWPEGGWDLPTLKLRRSDVGSYGWASLYQGQPRPRGSTVFGPPTFFSDLPHAYRVAHGIDLAYTEKTSADFSVVVTMFGTKMAISTPLDPRERIEEWFYVRHVRRKQVRAPMFRNELRLEHAEFGGEMRIYAAGTEMGAVDFMTMDELENGRVKVRGLPIEALAPRGDKFTRAIEFAAAWNAGRVLVPSPEFIQADPVEYDWVNDYLDIVRSFTGVSDVHDDDVDASVAAYDLLAEAPIHYPARSNPSTRRM